MSYPAGTVLKRTDPKDDELDVVRVVGPSPVRSASLEEWNGGTGDIMIVQPEGVFGAPASMPESIADSQYEVAEWPVEEPQEKVIETRQEALRRGRRLETPEQVFAREAKERAAAEAAEAKAAKRSNKQPQPDDVEPEVVAEA